MWHCLPPLTVCISESLCVDLLELDAHSITSTLLPEQINISWVGVAKYRPCPTHIYHHFLNNHVPHTHIEWKLYINPKMELPLFPDELKDVIMYFFKPKRENLAGPFRYFEPCLAIFTQNVVWECDLYIQPPHDNECDQYISLVVWDCGLYSLQQWGCFWLWLQIVMQCKHLCKHLISRIQSKTNVQH